MSTGLSRRHLFSILGRTFRATVDPPKVGVKPVAVRTFPPSPATEQPEKVAVIQGRFCLAYSSLCTVCSERCPVPGAIKVDKGIPMIISDICTGCGVCHDV